MSCKEICLRYKAKKPHDNNRYAIGQKRCNVCEIFVNWEGIFCPCCGYKLRIKPRKSQDKKKLKERIEQMIEVPIQYRSNTHIF